MNTELCGRCGRVHAGPCGGAAASSEPSLELDLARAPVRPAPPAALAMPPRAPTAPLPAFSGKTTISPMVVGVMLVVVALAGVVALVLFLAAKSPEEIEADHRACLAQAGASQEARMTCRLRADDCKRSRWSLGCTFGSP